MGNENPSHRNLGDTSLTGWRLNELEKRVNSVDSMFEARRVETDKAHDDLQRDLQTAFRRIDSLTLKAAIGGALCGTFGSAIVLVLMEAFFNHIFK